MKIKNYKLFLESNDFDFDFLANIGKMKEAIIKIVEVYEKHYYNDTKISSYDRFRQSVSDLIDSAVGGEDILAEEYLSIINLFEKEVYGKNLLSSTEEPMFGDIDELISRFNILLDNEKDNEDIEEFGKAVDDFLKMDDSWVLPEDKESTTSEINVENGMWTSEEEFEKDIESYIGKKMEDFDYSDKLQAYKYIENKEFVKNLLANGSQQDKNYINNFLSEMREDFEI